MLSLRIAIHKNIIKKYKYRVADKCFKKIVHQSMECHQGIREANGKTRNSNWPRWVWRTVLVMSLECMHNWW